MNWTPRHSRCGVLIDGIFWTWNPDKDESNQNDHQLSFELAAHVFSDPLSLTQLDEFRHEERMRTIGLVGSIHIIVIHTDPVEIDGVQTGRIISARKAEPVERRAYANGDW